MSETYGEKLVKLARKAVEKYLNESVVINADNSYGLTQKAGVFVTLNYLSNNKEYLRGCVGFPLAEKTLHQSVIEAAIAAATQDPRFEPINKEDIKNIIFEVSVLSPPQKIEVQNPKDYKNHIKIGRDGLILKCKYGSGLLLPQVPVELNWDIDEYLANICYKAGAPPDAWLMPESQLYKFGAIIYKEFEPNGNVKKVDL
ncbi:MAG TPA: TIGR00296 family protein [Nitrososphaeraceae archaeon]|nr:TIGR00296 family protein [Nitrososphaeraceae archaeon]